MSTLQLIREIIDPYRKRSLRVRRMHNQYIIRWNGNYDEVREIAITIMAGFANAENNYMIRIAKCLDETTRPVTDYWCDTAEGESIEAYMSEYTRQIQEIQARKN